jgi:hypothetical protein
VTHVPGFGDPGLRAVHDEQERARVEAFNKRWSGRRKIRTDEEKAARHKRYMEDYSASKKQDTSA